jgi:hypothetical protein
VVENPALEEFVRLVAGLKKNPLLSPHIRRGEVTFESLTLEDAAELLRQETAYHFLLAAAGLNRTSLKKEAASETAKIVAAPKRRAFAVRRRLPIRKSFADIANNAALLRKADLDRRSKGSIEALFRERLRAEGIPILMSPPVRHVPGILIGKRKPDGVYPDPATDAPPILYLEIKNVRRVADDIQKRLYEIAEASLEMKVLYGALELRGFALASTRAVLDGCSEYRGKLRAQIRKSLPAVIVLMLCSKTEAEKYRAGVEAFVDKVFFQEEIEECLEFLKEAIGPRTQA